MFTTIKRLLPKRYLLKLRFFYQNSLKDYFANLREKKLSKKKSRIYFVPFSSSKFIEAIKDKKIVSFDIFDTILIRPFECPKDLFKFIEIKYKEKDFTYRRIEAEQRARYNSPLEEVTIDEIYNEIIPKLQYLKEIELNYEYNLIRINPLIKEKYDIALSMGKEIIFTSDMYLEKQFIYSILSKNGVTEYKKLYVSSEIKKTKRTGTLFSYILTDLNISPAEIVHFGDNEKSDFHIPRYLGIQSYLLPKITEIPKNIKSQQWIHAFCNNKELLNRSIYKALISKNLLSNEFDNYLYKLGYVLGGPLVLSYLNFILHNASENNIDKLLFVSRDGWILREIYNA